VSDLPVTGWVGLLARLVVGGVWIAAGAVKLPDPYASKTAVAAYDVLPASWVSPVGLLLPPLEVVIGLVLVAGLFTRWAAVASSVLLVLFVVGIAQAWARGLTIDCGCFGGGGYDPDAAAKYPWEIARDVGLLALSAALVWLGPRTRWSLDGLLFGSARASARTEPREGA